jgi:hypothetical protein
VFVPALSRSASMRIVEAGDSTFVLEANALGCRAATTRHPAASVQLGRLFPVGEELFQPTMLIIEFTFECLNALSVTQFR